MSLHTYPASIPETYASGASEDDDLGTKRLSIRLSLLFLIGASTLGYALAYQAVSLTWRVFTGG